MVLLSALLWIIQIYSIIIIIRSVLTWFPNLDYRNPLVKFIIDITEPVLRYVRQIVPPQNGIDFSPMIVILGLFVFRMLIVGIF
jgi:YggT family protein